MGIGDWFKNILGLSEDEEDEPILEAAIPATDPLPKKSPQASQLASVLKKLTVVVITPSSFDEARKAVDSLKHGKPIMANFEDTDKEIARRFIDFVSGACYALDGVVEKIGKNVFLFATSNVAVASERLRNWEEGSRSGALDDID
ncbi:MAG: cell division protein SepF [Caldisericales bacterium]|nr:cell division protein SepF [Caldisericales bacterium]